MIHFSVVLDFTFKFTVFIFVGNFSVGDGTCGGGAIFPLLEELNDFGILPFELDDGTLLVVDFNFEVLFPFPDFILCRVGGDFCVLMSGSRCAPACLLTDFPNGCDTLGSNF